MKGACWFCHNSWRANNKEQHPLPSLPTPPHPPSPNLNPSHPHVHTHTHQRQRPLPSLSAPPPQNITPPPPPHPHTQPRGNTNATLLEAEEGGYIYRYAYNGAGEGVTWLSSRNYMVVDLAAGPTTYGPLVRQGGAVTPQGVPSVKVRGTGCGGGLLLLEGRGV